MKLKNILLTGLSMVLVAALSIAGTVAYLQDDDSAVNVMTLGNVSIRQDEYQRVEANGEFTSELEKFQQGKILMPVTYPGNRTADTVTIGDYTIELGDKEANYVDKIVAVTNNGKTDAYVRTLVAVPTGGADWEPNPVAANDCWLHWNIPTGYNNYWTLNGTPTLIEVDGIGYYVWEFVHKAALSKGETTYPMIRGFYMDQKVNNDDNGYFMEYADGTVKRIDDVKLGETVNILVLSQAVQAAGFADAQTALDTGFGKSSEKAAEWFKGSVSSSAVADDKAFEDALTSDEKTIVVTLNGDVTYDIAAWANEAMGGEATEQIIINGNGHTITFNNTNSDWNNIVTNGAKLIINNAKITNAGYNNGPWNRHDLNFACDVELNNVVSDKALAFKAGATLNNVIISDANTSDTYAIWIQPKGQTVTLNNCVIDMIACTDGRGIKIDEQYLGAGEAEKVILNVNDTAFMTEEKSAILVKSVAGAEINLNNVDIAGVKADPIHEVWVDEASASFADLVIVNGGKKIVEGDVKVDTVSNNAELSAALNNSTVDIVYVDNANITISGRPSAHSKDVVFNGGTVDNGTTGGFNKGLIDNGTVTYNNTTIIGSVSLYGEKVVFNNCTFDLTAISDYIWTYGAKEVEFNGCTFNTMGKAILVYNEGYVGSSVVTVNGCTFNATASAYASAVPGQPCAAVEIDSSLIPGTYTLNFVGENVVDTEFSGLVRVKNDGGKGNVVINGATAVTLP